MKKILIFFALFIIGLYSAQNYYFVKDDISNVYNFQQMVSTDSFLNVFKKISSNEWLGYAPRSFFLTWIFQAFIIKIFGLNDIFSAQIWFGIFGVIIQSASSLLIYRIIKGFGFGNFYSSMFGILYFFSPASFVNMQISNNWFFIIPFFFLMLLIKILQNYNFWIDSYKKLFLIFFIACGALFSGEQLIVITIIFLILVSISWSSLFLKKKFVFNIRSLIIVILLIGSFVWYMKIYVGELYLGENIIWKQKLTLENFFSYKTLSTIFFYNLSLVRLFITFLFPNSHIYAHGLAFLNIPTFITLILITLFAINYWKEDKINYKISKNFIFILAILLFSSFIPMYYASLVGSRPGPEERYVAIPLFFIFISIFVLASIFKVKKNLIKSFLFIIVAWNCILTSNLMITLFPLQKKIDSQIYKFIEDNKLYDLDYLLTVNNENIKEHRGLVRPYLSAAWTDFQADWGFNTRMTILYKKTPVLLNNIKISENKKEVIGVNYWGKEYKNLKEGKIKILYLNDGPKMFDILNPKLKIISLEDFIETCEQKIKFFKACGNL